MFNYYDWSDITTKQGIYMGCVWVGVFVIYYLSLKIAFSSIGENLLRFFNNVRSLETYEEEARLRPLFNEVYEKVKAKFPEMAEHKIDIYIIDSMSVNACAIGLRTVAVTKGALTTFKNDEQLKAIIAHELAHIYHTDTFAKIFILIGNGIFTFGILIAKVIWWLIGRVPAFRNVMNTVQMVFDAIIFAFLFPMMIVLAIRDRDSEAQADRFAYNFGYGEDLVDALYRLEKMRFGGEGILIEKLLASHPRITRRIRLLEHYLGIEWKE